MVTVHLGASAIGGMLIGMIFESLSYRIVCGIPMVTRNSNRLNGKVWTIQRLNPKLKQYTVNEQKNNEKIIDYVARRFY